MTTSLTEGAPSPAVPGYKKQIIIADDDPGILDAVGIMLDMAGYAVQTFLNGSFVSGITPGAYPDLILLDIWMSGEDGTEICRQLKSNEVTRQIPVILFSASKEVEQSAYDAGADDFLAKPFEMDELLRKVGRLVNAPVAPSS